MITQDEDIRCPYCGSLWVEPYGKAAYECRKCWVKFNVGVVLVRATPQEEKDG